MEIKNLLELFNQNFTLFAVFPSIILLGFYLTCKLGFVQILELKSSFLCLTKKNSSEGNISRFEALSTVLAGNFGTGNISGMAVAIATGGPGALVWMWVMAFFGAAIQYASCFLSVLYRKKTADGEFVGGPMYYLRDALGYKGLATLFSVFAIFGAITVGNFAQINSVILPLEQLGFNPFYCSIIIATLVGMVILGGIQRIANFASYIVPFKALLYLGTACLILAMHADRIIPALELMFRHAFGYEAVAGGVLGMGVLKALTTGFDRGLFATDAGTGIVPILQASARSENPVLDGIATLVAPLMVMIVCTATGLVLIVTGAWQETHLQSTNMVTYAFSRGLGSPVGSYIVIFALILFAYTTILAWAYCGEKAFGFLFGPKYASLFRIGYIALVPVSTFVHVSMIWTLADIAITLMLAVNLIAVMKLAPQVILHTRNYKNKTQLAPSSK